MKNKVVWITGASSGIGEALAYQLNELGAKLIISSRNREALYTGHIVVISSLVGKFGTKGRSAYSASKHALHGYFDSLRNEIDTQIKISIICPGYIKTNLSYNALLANGNRQNKMDDAQANGMPADECANQVIKAIKAGKEEVYIGGKEKYAVLLKRYFPRIFSKIVRKAKVT